MPILALPGLMPIRCTLEKSYCYCISRCNRREWHMLSNHPHEAYTKLMLQIPKHRFSVGAMSPNIRAFSQRFFILNIFWRICVVVGSQWFCISPTVRYLHTNPLLDSSIAANTAELSVAISRDYWEEKRGFLMRQNLLIGRSNHQGKSHERGRSKSLS